MQCRRLYQSVRWVGLMMGASLVCIASHAQPGNPPAEGGNRINIESTDVFHFASFGKDSLRIRKLLGNVILSQDTTKLYCDSAYQFIDSNFVEAFSHVRIVMSAHLPDSMRRTITADRLTFDGETKIINFWDNVVLTDKDVTLRTPRLTYYRIEDFAEYLQGGVIENDSNTLSSQKGYYYPKTDMAYFRNSVVLVNPDFILNTDTLGYNTETKVAFFMAPTTVHDSVNNMYTEDGYYDTENDFVFLRQHASIGDTSYTLFADTIEYDEQRDLGRAMGHVRVVQHDSSLTVYGKYGEFQSKTEASFVTDSAFAVQYFDDDTLYLFADTLSSYKDTVTDKRYFEAYFKAHFYLNDLQGVCDSLVYWYDDSVMFFYRRPALWSDNSQITGDTIIMYMKGGGIDSMSIPSTPYIITQEDTVGFDQIRGKSLQAKFSEKKLKKMWIYGNSESIYYTKDDHEEYLGMNKARCSDMYVEFKENKPSRILFKEKPEGEFFPIHLVLFKSYKLEGFEWRIAERPSYPDWVLEYMSKLEGRRDSIQMRLDSVLMLLEEIEFEIHELLNDTLLHPFLDSMPAAPLTPPDGDSLSGIQDSLAATTVDSLKPETVDSLPEMVEDSASVPLVTKPYWPPGIYQPWEMQEQQFDKHGRLLRSLPSHPPTVAPPPDSLNIKMETATGPEPASNSSEPNQQELKQPGDAQPKAERPKRSFKERWKTFKANFKAFRKRMKDGPTKEQVAARETARLDRMKRRIQAKAVRDQQRHQRKLKRRQPVEGSGSDN